MEMKPMKMKKSDILSLILCLSVIVFLITLTYTALTDNFIPLFVIFIIVCVVWYVNMKLL